MRRALSALLAGLLAVSAIAAVAPGDVTAELSPREGRAAVSTTGDSNRLFLGGEVPSGSQPTATLQALDHTDAVVETWDVSDDVVVTDGTVSGSVPVQCFYVPDCPGTAPDSPERTAALDALGGYRLQLAVGDVSDLSGVVEFDPEPPLISRYALTGPTTIEVRFTEDVTDPDGDAAGDWEVDDLRQVASVQGLGDTRVLTLLTPYEDGDTPEVFYLPTPSLDSQNLPNRPYVDRAGNELDAEGRLGLAADEIPPPVPTIEAIEGTAVTYQDEDRAVPVLGNDATPEVTIGDVPEGAIAQLFLDDGDGVFEPDTDDALVGEAPGDGSGSATVSSAALADGVHRFYARSRDEALCDPNDESAGTCPNHSGRSEEARYDLDTVAPTPVGDAVGHANTIALQFTEPLVGADGAGQWTVTNPGGGAVTVEEVTGSGDTRTLQFSGGPLVDSPTPTLDWTAPSSDPYRDEHGNELTGFPVDVAAAPLPVLSVEPADVTEGDPSLVGAVEPAPTLEFTLRVSDIPQGQQVDVAYETILGGDGDAGPDDYEHVEGTATITGVEGGPDETVVSVTVTRDELHEFDEAVFLQVRNVDDGAPQFTLPGDAAALTTSADILDDDDPVEATISPATADVGEGGDASTTMTVQLDAVSGRPVTIDWATVVAEDPAEGQAGAADVPAQSGSVTIPAGQQHGTFQVEVADDGIDEPGETFSVDLSAPPADANATLGDPSSATLTIIDDDVPVPTLRVEPGSVAEDDYTLPVLTNAELPFTFTLSQAPEQPIEVSWTTNDAGTAVEDVDFTGDSGFVRFEQGQTEQTVLVDVTDDDLYEDDETVALRVADPAAAVLVDAADEPVDELTAMGTITNDDPLPTVAYADDAGVTVDEGDWATFTVELDPVSGRDATVQWETVFDGTADAQDLPHQSDTVVVPAGQTTATFKVATTPDAATNGERTITIELSSPEHAERGEPFRSTLTILDDTDGVPTITVSGGEGDEDTGALPPLTSTSPVPFTVELSRTSDQDVTVRYRTTDRGTATPESDFAAAAGTLTVPAGETVGTVDVEVLDDDLDEPAETGELRLREPVNAALDGDGPTLATTGTIRDDDDPVVASLGGDDTVAEGEAIVLEVTLDAPSGQPVTVDWQTVDQSADGADFEQSSGTLEFDPDTGETSRTITIPTFDDPDVEGDEAFRVELTGAEHAEIGDGQAVVTITDNDAAIPGRNVLSMSSATVDEGDPVGPFPALIPTNGLDFALTLQEPASEQVQVDYVVTAGTADGTSPAGEGRDVELEPDGTATIPANDQSATIEVGTYTDLLDEFDETVIVTITEVRGGDAVLPSAGLERTGRILDDDPPAEVAFAADSVEAEVTEGGTALFTVELDTASGKPVTVAWATSYDGTADTDDVLRQSGQVTVAAGRTTATFEVQTEDDAVREGDEDLSIVLSDPHHGRLSDARPTTARLVLLDDELPVLTVEGGSVNEANVGILGSNDPGLGLEAASTGPALVAAAVSPLEEDLPFTVTLAEAVAQDATVRWTTTTLGTATAGSDYTAASGTLTIPAGQTEGEVLVDVHLDELDEWDETVVVRFSDARGARLADGAEAVEVAGTIIDDDLPVTVDLGEDVEVTEGETARFEITLSDADGNEKDSGKDIELRYRTSDGTARAGQDYRATDATLTIPAGDTSATFTVATLDDSVAEPVEDLQVTLEVVDEDTADLGRGVGTLEILDDDDLGIDPDATVVSLTGDAVEEGDPAAPLPVGRNALSFVVELSEPADGDVTLDYVTRPGSASAGDDYEAADGQVTIADGEQAATVTVPVEPDFTDEFDEDLQLVLTDVSGDAILPGGELARTGRILDDDAQAQLRTNDATVLEGDVAELDVTLDNASGKDITVTWELVDGTATAGDDYVADSGTMSFPAGTTSRTVQVATLADEDTGELIEQLELVLSDATNAGIDDSRGTISIVDLDAGGLPTSTAVFLEDITTREADGDRTALVPVRLSGERDEDTTVTWSTQELTATEGEDYRAEGGQVTIPAGVTSAHIPVTIIGDEEVEPNEDLLVLLTEAEGAVITGPTGRVTIEDDDSADDGTDDRPGGGDDLDGAPDGSPGTDGSGESGDGSAGQGAGELPATGGGAGFAVLGLALLAARRRREHG